MKVYLKKINQKQLVFSEDFLREFTGQLSGNDAIYLQDLNSNPVSHPFSWFSSNDFYQYIMNLIKVDNNEANNLLIIYQIKLNYYIVSVINIQTEEYNSLQWSSMWIDTNEKLSQLENKLVANTEVLKLAFKVYFDVVPQLHDKNNYYKESTQDNYLMALDMVDKKLGIPIFSSFSKVNTDGMINELKLINEEKDNEVFNKINNHNRLTAAIRTYTDFFNNWLENGRLDLSIMDDNNVKSNYIVFAYQINDSKLTGLVKIGQVAFSPALANGIALTDDNHLFAYLAAQEVVRQHHISGNDVKILYSTIATKNDGSPFDANDVDKWLGKNNYLPENLSNNFVGWYCLNINQIKRAINAIKNQEEYCDIDTEINLSANENNAIKNTFSWWEKQNRFFWICTEINNVIIPTLFLIKKSMQINSLKFNHVLIIDSNLKDKNSWFKQFNNVKLDVHSYSFYSELNNEDDIRFNKSNLNDDNKFIYFLDFSSIVNHQKAISDCFWDLIVINQMDKNITTELENTISRNSPNSKWLYFSDSIPIFFLDSKNKQNSNDFDCNNHVQLLSESKNSLLTEKIYFATPLDNIDLLYSKPTEVVIDNQNILCHSWRELLLNICDFLYKKYGNDFIKKIPHKDISENKNVFHDPRKISNSKYWIESNYSSESIYNISQNFLKLLNIPLDKAYLIINRKK